ncbi:MAG TPA: class I SAM-dependent methyltransferase [Gaiellaceae bacterium]|nr:class I SAM-dependent methyltransferase [Gaiellaceae bacterium]
MYEAVIDAVFDEPGRRLLDAGCGSGLAAALARQRGFVVSGFDAAPGLLEVARERVPDADFREGDLEQAPFDDHTFDAVIACNAVQYAANHGRAVRELARVAVPGGRIGIAMWAEHDRSEMSAVFDALGALMPPPPPGAPAPFALERPGALEELMNDAGISVDGGEDVPATFTYADLETAMRGQLSAGVLVRMEEAVGRERVHVTLSEVLERFQRSDGTVVFENMFRYVVGRAPD